MMRTFAWEHTPGESNFNSLSGKQPNYTVLASMLSNTTAGAASGMLSATGQNVHLDSGTQLLMNVAAQQQ